MKLRVLFLLLLLALLVTGCIRSSVPEVTSTVSVQSTATVPPTSSPTSSPEVVLFTRPSRENSKLDILNVEQLNDLAAASGLAVKEIDFEDLGTEMDAQTRLVVALEGDESIVDLARENPSTGFITYAVFQNAPENLYQIRPHQDRYDQSGFFAGYIAALVTPDYRVGGIALAGDGRENAALQGFFNGSVFYCGLCRPKYPPFNDYPQIVFVSEPDPFEVSASVQSLIDLGVTTIYISPRLNNEAILSVLKDQSVQLIGNRNPIDLNGLNWVATVEPDARFALEQAWQSWLAGEAGYVLDAPMVVLEGNNDHISPGKKEYLKKISADLASGRIDPAVDPLTGEPR